MNEEMTDESSDIEVKVLTPDAADAIVKEFIGSIFGARDAAKNAADREPEHWDTPIREEILRNRLNNIITDTFCDDWTMIGFSQDRPGAQYTATMEKRVEENAELGAHIVLPARVLFHITLGMVVEEL